MTDIIGQTNQAAAHSTLQVASTWESDLIELILKLQMDTFSMDRLYQYGKLLKAKHPGNNHVKPKIRQKLQVLVKKGFLTRKSDGVYSIKREQATQNSITS